jgi:hypothetical protein
LCIEYSYCTQETQGELVTHLLANEARRQQSIGLNGIDEEITVIGFSDEGAHQSPMDSPLLGRYILRLRPTDVLLPLAGRARGRLLRGGAGPSHWANETGDENKPRMRVPSSNASLPPSSVRPEAFFASTGQKKAGAELH